jgi:DNA-binding winged helix-turn-helix (wHTH) protein
MDKVFVSYSPTTESERILHTISGVATGFYIENGWYVLPCLKKYQKVNSSVLLPTLNYLDILGSYKSISSNKKYKDNSENTVTNKQLLNKVESEIIKSKVFVPLDKSKLNKLEKEYSKLLLPAIRQIKQSIPIYKDIDFNICVKPTHFGVCMSFDSIKQKDFEKKFVDICITVRLDWPIEQVLEGLASSVSRGLIEATNTWRETEAVSDFITKYVLGAYNVKGTINSVSKRDDKLLHKSIEYLLSLQAPINLPLNFNADQNVISYYGENVTNHFSPYEFRVLKMLITNKNKTVSIDEISEGIYKTNADLKFTLWGITKTVQRVRDKLEEIGVPRTMIQNVKGEGFKLLG